MHPCDRGPRRRHHPRRRCAEERIRRGGRFRIGGAWYLYDGDGPVFKDTLDRAVDWLLAGKHEWRLVEEAILGVVGSIDKPGSPAGEAKDAFFSNLYGRTPERRQEFRQRVMQVTLEDLQRVGEIYLRPENANIAVISGPTAEGRCRDLGLDVKML